MRAVIKDGFHKMLDPRTLTRQDLNNIEEPINNKEISLIIVKTISHKIVIKQRTNLYPRPFQQFSAITRASRSTTLMISTAPLMLERIISGRKGINHFAT